MSSYDLIFLAEGTAITLLLSLVTIVVSIPLAILIGLYRSLVIKNPIVSLFKFIINTCIVTIRGTPLMLQLMFVFFGLPFMGINLSPLISAFIALGIYSVAYLTEIVRTGIESISKTQWDGAESLGFNYYQTMKLIILPQAFKIMIPPTVSFFIGLIKDSSLCAVIGLVELARAGRIIVERSHEALLIFSTIAFIYFVLCFPLSRLSKRLECKLGA